MQAASQAGWIGVWSFSVRISDPSSNLLANAVVILDRPVLHLIPCRVQRALVVEQADPEGGKGADAVPRAAIGTAHFQEAFEAHFREGGREVVGPVGQPRQLARGHGWLARALAVPALLALGEASYALYILQEPVFVWLTALQHGLTPTDTVLDGPLRIGT